MTLKMSYNHAKKILNSNFAPLFKRIGVTKDLELMYLETELTDNEVDLVSGFVKTKN